MGTLNFTINYYLCLILDVVCLLNAFMPGRHSISMNAEFRIKKNETQAMDFLVGMELGQTMITH